MKKSISNHSTTFFVFKTFLIQYLTNFWGTNFTDFQNQKLMNEPLLQITQSTNTNPFGYGKCFRMLTRNLQPLKEEV